MSIGSVNFRGPAMRSLPSPIELLDHALSALNRYDSDEASRCVKQLPTPIANQIFQLVWETRGRPADVGDHFGKDAFFGQNGRSCDMELKKAILEQIIGERSSYLQKACNSQAIPATPTPSQNSTPGAFSRITGTFLTLVKQLVKQPTKYLSREHRVVTHIKSANILLPAALVQIIIDYEDTIERFGAAEWRHYFQVDVGPEPELPSRFYDFWDGPDPINPAQRAPDTHLLFLCPQWVTFETGERRPYNLKLLDQLVQNPRPGERRAKFWPHLAHQIISLGADPDAELLPEPPAWLVLRRDVVGQGLKFEELEELIHDLNRRTHAGYTIPSPIDLPTGVFVYHVLTGQRLIGDYSGAEGRPTRSYTSMGSFGLPCVRLVFGYFSSFDGERGDSWGLHHSCVGVGSHDQGNNTGVILIRVFTTTGAGRSPSGPWIPRVPREEPSRFECRGGGWDYDD